MFDTLVQAIRETVPFPGVLTDAALIDVISALHRAESVLMERKLAVIAEFTDRRLSETDATESGCAAEIAEAEVGAALTVGRAEAGRLSALATTLADRLPRVRAALARGEIDLYRAGLIAAATRNVDAAFIGEVERAALDKILPPGGPEGIGLTGRRARNAIDRIINQIDPAGVRERRRRATNDRYVGVSAGEDAMITLFGSLPAEHGRKFDTRLRELAATPCPEDGRTFAQRKADAVTALVEGLDYLPCTCERQDCPQHRGDLRAARKPLVHVVLLGSTLDGHDDEPGYLDGYGLIDAEHARELATDADIDYVRVPADVHYQRTRNTPSDTVTIADTDKGAATGTGSGGTDAEATNSHTTDTSAVVEDSVTEGADTGAVLPDSAYAYRANAVLDTWIRILCGTCQWPHCDTPAWNTDLDHDISFDHTDPTRGGKTTAASMKAYCRTHHRIKHSGSWIECHNSDRSIDYISPTGHRYHNPATGYLDLLGISPDDITDPDQNTHTRRRRTRAENKAASIRAERRHQQTRIHLGRIRRTTTYPPTSDEPPHDDVPCPF